MRIGKVIQYDIHIEPTFNEGFIAKVGCAKLAFSNKDDLLSALKDYLANPDKFEKAYISCGGAEEAVRAEPRLETPRTGLRDSGGGRTPTQTESTCESPG